jgi:hypothetical protein
VVQTKGPEEWIASPEYTTNSTDTTEQTRLGKLRSKSLRTIQPDFFILNKNRRVLGTQSNLHRSIRVPGERFPKHPPKSQMERVFWGDQQSRRSTYLLIDTGSPGGSETEGFITSRIPFVNMIGTGLDTGHMKPQLLEHKLNQTVLIPGTPKIGVPTFFSFFNQRIFHFKKLFLCL